jgi:lantibiotic modifying enzyme
MKWTALIDTAKGRDLHNRIRRKLDEIAGILFRTDSLEPSVKLPGLLDGRTGIVLFLFYYAALTRSQEYMDHAFDILSGILDQAAEIDFLEGRDMFSAGLPGIGWAVEHLAQNRFIDAATNDILEELDQDLYNGMIRNLEAGNYDYTNGALGSALYFLSRKTLPQSSVFLAHLVDGLEKISRADRGGGLKWESIKDYKTGEKGFGISLSHGISSIIAILAKILEQETIETGTRLTANRLLAGAVTYLLNQRLDRGSGDYFSCFPRWALESGPVVSSRLAWCYGDLGIAMALWQAARTAKHNGWEKIALDVFSRAGQRRDLEQNRVCDAGLCHGAAGIAHIFNRVHHYTGQTQFKAAAVYWLEKTLEMASFDSGYAGYKVKYADEAGGLTDKAGLLEGIAGIGLVYISMISAVEPKWDRCLLLS